MKDSMSLPAKDGATVNLGRHQAQCTICQHPNCQDIEELYVNWISPNRICNLYNVGRYSLIRHAHAVGLYEKRKKRYLRVFEMVMERAEEAQPSASAVVSAANAYAKLTKQEEAEEAVPASKLKDFWKRMSAAERQAFARDGSLPASYAEEENATAVETSGMVSADAPAAKPTTVQ